MHVEAISLLTRDLVIALMLYLASAFTSFEIIAKVHWSREKIQVEALEVDSIFHLTGTK
jgi:hypothetical protein